MTPGPRPAPRESRESDALAWGAVHLDVTDPSRSAGFWQGVLGLEPVGADRDDDALALGAGETPLVVLHPGATAPAPRGHSGLYHLALHVPTEADFAAVILRAAAHHWAQAPTDHVTHWATYLDDPDGIQVEIAFETIDRVTRYESGPGWPLIVDSEGRERRAVDVLDIDAVLGHAAPGASDAPMAPGTVVGHLHLHVRDLGEATTFYVDSLGMLPGVSAPAIGFADLSFGGSFPHRLAVNTWQRPGLPRPPGVAGMRHACLHSPATSAHPGPARPVRDPSGNVLLVSGR